MSRRERRQLHRAAAAGAVATTGSRVAGYVRDMVVAGYFGAGAAADAFFVAFSLPSAFRTLFAEGALASAFVPVLARERESGSPDAVFRTANALMGIACLGLAILSVAGILLAPQLVALLAPGFSLVPGKVPLTTLLARVCFPYLLLLGVAAVCSAILNVFGRFFAPAASTAAMNLGMIAVVVLLAPRLPLPALALALGVVGGGILQVAAHWPSLRSIGYRFRPRIDLADPGLRRMALLILPATYGMAIYQVAVLVNRWMASYLPDGSVSYLWYGLRLMQFPLGVFGVAISTAILPALSRHAASGDRPAFASTFSAGVRTTLVFAVPATAGLILLAEPIIGVLFERGAFTHAQTVGTATALVWYAAGLTAYSLQKVVLTSFYAALDIATPVAAGTVSLAIGVLLNMILIGPLGHAGLALSTSVSVTVNLLLLAWLLRRRSGPLGGREMAASAARIVAATGVMAAAVAGARALLPPAAGLAGLPALAVIIAAGGGVYVIAGRVLGVREIGELRESFSRGGAEGPA